MHEGPVGIKYWCEEHEPPRFCVLLKWHLRSAIQQLVIELEIFNRVMLLRLLKALPREYGRKQEFFPESWQDFCVEFCTIRLMSPNSPRSTEVRLIVWFQFSGGSPPGYLQAGYFYTRFLRRFPLFSPIFTMKLTVFPLPETAQSPFFNSIRAHLRATYALSCNVRPLGVSTTYPVYAVISRY